MYQIRNLHFGRKPGTARLSNRMNSVIVAIGKCLEEKAPFPALMLIYSSIDILGSLQNPDGYSTRDFFKDWAKNYLLKEKALLCNETDLWGARNGILHTMRYDAQRPELGQREIVYGIRGNDSDIKNIKDPNKQVGVYVEDLYEALAKAYLKYLEELENSTDPNKNSNLERLPKYIDLIPMRGFTSEAPQENS